MTENGTIDIHYKGRVRIGRLRVVHRSQDVTVNAIAGIGRHARGGKELRGKVSAPTLVVRSPGRVDDVVKPQCGLDFAGKPGKGTERIKLSQAGVDMRDGVIVTMPLRVCNTLLFQKSRLRIFLDFLRHMNWNPRESPGELLG